jgi:hypothetical protein
MQIDTSTREGRLLYVAIAKLINHKDCHIDFPAAPDGPAVITILEDIARQMEDLGMIQKGKEK